MGDRHQSTARSVMVSTIGNAFPPLAALVTAPLLARGLGVEARGEVAAAQAIALLMVSVTAFGLPDAITHFVARGAAGERKTHVKLVAFTLVTGAIASLVMVSFSDWLGGGQESTSLLINIAAASVAPAMLLGLLRGQAAGRGEWVKIAAERIGGSAARLVATAILFGAGYLTPVTATVVLVFGPLLGVIPYLLPNSPRHAISPPEITSGQFASYSVRIWVGAISGILLMRIDQSLLLPIAGATQLGLYAVAVALSEVPLVINSAVRDVAFSQHSTSFDAKRLSSAARIASTLCFVVAATMAVAMPWVLPMMFGSEFADAVPVVWLLLVAVVLGTPGAIAGAGLSAVGRPGLRSVSLSVAALVNVLALAILAPMYGAMGAAGATLIGNLVSSNLNIYWLHRYGNCHWGQFYVYRPSDLLLLQQIVCLVTRRQRA